MTLGPAEGILARAPQEKEVTLTDADVQISISLCTLWIYLLDHDYLEESRAFTKIRQCPKWLLASDCELKIEVGIRQRNWKGKHNQAKSC